MKVPIPLLKSLAIVCFLPHAGAIHASEWNTVTLSGKFEAVIGESEASQYTTSTGATQYSSAVNNVVGSNGDIRVTVLMPRLPLVRLEGGLLLDLGKREQSPLTIMPPSDFVSDPKTDKYNSRNARLLEGHWYYMHTEKDGHVVFLIEAMTVGEMQKTNRVRYYIFSRAPIGEVDVALTLRVQSSKSLEALNTALASESSDEGTEGPPATSSSSTSKPGEPGNVPGQQESLLTRYDDFQASTSAFLDLPLDQATVVACDQLIDVGAATKSTISQELALLEEQIRTGTADIEKYKDRLERVSNLQLKDRVTTKINQLEAKNQERRVNAKEWEAKKNELEVSLQTLREYRDILK